jgi:hypothetical protein
MCMLGGKWWKGMFLWHTGHKDDFALDSLQVCIVDGDFGHVFY